jgi:L-asparaginase II
VQDREVEVAAAGAAYPVVAEVVRSGFVEGHHHGSAVVVRAGPVRDDSVRDDSVGDSVGDESVLDSVGPVELPMLPRSSAKPLQATGMLRLGLEVDTEELAVICGSHTGQPMHVAVVRRLLAGVGLGEADLDNTPAMPVDRETRRAMTVAGEGPTSITQNCSGKHAGMLATCVVNGWPTAGYRDPAHPLQIALRATVEDLTGDSVTATVVDGCGAPLFAVTLVGLARAFARIAMAPGESAEGRCAAAMRAHPALVGGTGHDVTRLMTEVPGLIAKDGAEGVYAAATADGIGVAVKIDDGAARPRLPVLVAALRRAGVDAAGFADFATVPVLGHGDPVGEVHAVP